MFERLSRFVGRRELRRLMKAVDTAVRYEVSQALRFDNLPKVFPKLTRRFWSRVELHISVITDRVFDNVVSLEDLKEFRKVEMDLARHTAKLLRNTGYEHAEDLVYGLSIMIEHDLWLVEKVVKLGLDELLEKLSERALTETLELSSYLRYLGFAWISATTATLGIIKEYKVENRDTLSQWCDPLLASLRGFTPLPSGLSVFRSDARTSSFSASPRLRHHSSGPGGLGSGGTIGIFLPTPAPLHSLLVVALALYLFRLPIVAVEA